MCVLAERTKEMQAHARRRSELDRMQRMFRQAPGFMCITQGPSHEYAIVNGAFERLIGHSDAEVLGRTVQDVLPEIVDQGYVELLDRVFATGEPFIGRAMPVRLARTAPGGAPETSYVDFVHQPIVDDNGSIWGIFTQGADVTDRVLAEQALREANANKDKFLAVLGHELRNPLAPIYTAAQVLRRLVHDNEGAVKCVDVIARQAQQMSTLVEDLMDITRISNGLLTLKSERVDLNAVAQGAVDQMRNKASERAHALHVTLPQAHAFVIGDPMRLTQVVSNLLSNAIRYTPRGGTIEVSVARCAGRIRLEVKDNGEGIAPELMPNLFVQFAQEKRSADRASGLGIGLPLVKALVNAHSGRIEVISEGPGSGSRFLIDLPSA
jgi:PAS domain S-box-containing protein